LPGFLLTGVLTPAAGRRGLLIILLGIALLGLLGIALLIALLRLRILLGLLGVALLLIALLRLRILLGLLGIALLLIALLRLHILLGIALLLIALLRRGILLGLLGIALLLITLLRRGVLLGLLGIALLLGVLLIALRIPLLLIIIALLGIAIALRILLVSLLRIGILRKSIGLGLFEQGLFDQLHAQIIDLSLQRAEGLGLLGLLSLFAVGHLIGIENKADHQGADQDGHIDAGGILDIFRHMAQRRHGKDNLTNQVVLAHQFTVRMIIGIALGAELIFVGIGFAGHLFHDTVGGHGLAAIHAEGDNVIDLQAVVIHFFYIDQ